MATSLRFVSILLGLAAVGAIVSLIVLDRQDTRRSSVTAEQSTGGSVDAGREAMVRLGCGTCHVARDVAGPHGKVGPSLVGFATRRQIAGTLSNEPANLMRWLQHPQQILPGNGMPDQGIDDADARDLAAFLYTMTSDH